ncbi:MAG: NTP transferase domain-containing protein [Lachnospiraceae bacterium]|nr:NTP transferase domain-containing protein [Lachnospiraceae bacterium]
MESENQKKPVIKGVILAAGMSSRMGQFKPMLQVGDTSFIKRIIHTMRAAGLEDILVVTGAGRDELAEHLADENVRLLFNAQYETTQMLESVKLAIREVQRIADAIVLTPVDICLPGIPVYRGLLRKVYSADCVRPVYDGRPGHPVLIGKRVFSAVLGYMGPGGLKGALKDAGATTVSEEVNDPGILFDADTPEDYELLLQMVNSKKDYIVVAGGLNIDIGGTSHVPMIMHDSNPGIVKISSGGVARNIAHNLSLLKQQVYLLTAYGDDHYRDLIEKEADAAGIDLTCALRPYGERSATYLFVNESDGNLAVAINDMQICRHLTPDYFAQHLDLINGARLLVLDANLPEESIAYLTENAKVPVFADVVSVAKAERFLPYLGKIHTIKPNILEAEKLSGVKITDEASLRKAGEKIHAMGVKNVFLSTGGSGLLIVNDEGVQTVEPCRAKPVNMTGAGDACLAALIVAYLQGKSAAECGQYGNAAASIAIESMYTISEKMNLIEVEARVKQYKQQKDEG